VADVGTVRAPDDVKKATSNWAVEPDVRLNGTPWASRGEIVNNASLIYDNLADQSNFPN